MAACDRLAARGGKLAMRRGTKCERAARASCVRRSWCADGRPADRGAHHALGIAARETIGVARGSGAALVCRRREMD